MGMTQHRLVISNGVLPRGIVEIVRGARRITTGTFLWGEAAILDHFVVAPWPQNREVLGVAGKLARDHGVLATSPCAGRWPSDGAYPHATRYVVSHQPLPASPLAQWVDRDPPGFIADLKRQPGRDIWLCGCGTRCASNSGYHCEEDLSLQVSTQQ